MRDCQFFAIDFPICRWLISLIPPPKPVPRKFKPLSREAYELGKKPYLGPRK